MRTRVGMTASSCRKGLLTSVGAALLLALAPPQVQAQDSHLVVVTGLGGAPQYEERFRDWSLTLLDAAREAGVADANLHWLTEDPDAHPRTDGRSDRETVDATLAELAERAGPEDRVFIVLVGHGSHRRGESRINLPGRDLSAADFAGLLDRFQDQEIVFVNTASASGEFVRALSGANRTVVTATRSGREGNATLFGGPFARAFASDDADTDKDGRVSVLEAFRYARHRVARDYEEDDRLLTEHALLDDDGDGEGSEEPSADAGDGARAARLFLSSVGDAARAAGGTEAPADSVLRRLYAEKAELESRIAELRAVRGEMESERYERELESLLVELALKTREIEERESEGGGS